MRLVFCLILALICGCGPKSNSVAVNAAAKPWVTFTHPSGKFSVLVPELPEAKSRQNGAQTRTVFASMYGTSASIAMAEIPNEETLDLSDLPANQEMLKELLRANHPTSKILSERAFVVQGKYPAIDAAMEIVVPKAGLAKQRLRMVVLPQVTIMILVVGKPAEVDSAEITKCLDSLQLRG